MNLEIKLDEATHKYTDMYNRVYTSVTTIIGKYEKPFDKEYWGVWTVLKEMGIKGIRPSPEDRTFLVGGTRLTLDQIHADKSLRAESRKKRMFDKWDKITKEACARGTKTHNYIEDNTNNFYSNKGTFAAVNDTTLLQGENPPVKKKYSSGTGFEVEGFVYDKKAIETSPLRKRYPTIYQLMVNLIDKGYTLIAECRVYIEEFLVAGTIDLLAIKGKDFAIIDWKTNKDILQFTSGYYKKVEVLRDGRRTWIKSDEWVYKDERMLAPVEHLQKCKGVIYSLQLSIYAWIMEYYGFTWRKSILVHIRTTDEREYEPVFYTTIPYYKLEARKLLEHHHTTKLKEMEESKNGNVSKTTT